MCKPVPKWCNPPLLRTLHLKVKCKENVCGMSAVLTCTCRTWETVWGRSSGLLVTTNPEFETPAARGNCQCCHPLLHRPLRHYSASLCFEGFKAGGLLGFDIRESKTTLNLEEQIERRWERLGVEHHCSSMHQCLFSRSAGNGGTNETAAQ